MPKTRDPTYSQLNDRIVERLRPLRNLSNREGCAMKQSNPAPRGVVFQYLVPVHVEVEGGQVICVTVINEMPVSHPTLVEGNRADLDDAVRAADDGQSWPSWQFGY